MRGEYRIKVDHIDDYDPIYTKLVDKYEVKEYIEKNRRYCISTLGVWDSFDEIDFNDLPNQFVLKCTYDSESIVIVKDRNLFDVEQEKMKIKNVPKQNFFISEENGPVKRLSKELLPSLIWKML